jgi:hypothetical protein
MYLLHHALKSCRDLADLHLGQADPQEDNTNTSQAVQPDGNDSVPMDFSEPAAQEDMKCSPEQLQRDAAAALEGQLHTTALQKSQQALSMCAGLLSSLLCNLALTHIKLQRPVSAVVFAVTAMVCNPASSRPYERLCAATDMLGWYEYTAAFSAIGLLHAPEHVVMKRLGAEAGAKLGLLKYVRGSQMHS